MDDFFESFQNPNLPSRNNNSKEEFSIKKRPNEILLDQAKLKLQYLVKIGPNNIPVYFPHEPYQIQIAYMEKVIEALETKQNALLQSPTGTGKTLCLLCASLGWLSYRRTQDKDKNDKKSRPIRLIYSSRTHAQLKQVMKELKTTAYKPFCTTIGSRDHYCIKSEFSNIKGTVLNASCAKARKMKMKVFQKEAQNEGDEIIDHCKYYQTENEMMNYTIPKLFNPNSIKGSDLMDIEDLKKDGKMNGFCPYYVSMKIINDVDILFLPYNYLLEKRLRSVLKLSLENAAIIFDEAHNIEQIAEEGSSYELSFLNLETALKEIEDLKELHRKISTVNSFDKKKNKYELDMPETLRSLPEECQLLSTPITSFKNKIKKILNGESPYVVNTYNKDEKGILLEAKDILDFIEKSSKSTEVNYFELDKKKNPYADGWNISNLKDYIDILQKVLEDLSFAAIFGIDKLLLFLSEIFVLWSNNSLMLQNQGKFDWELNRINHYKLYIRNDPEDPNNVLIYLWCFSPSLSFQDIMQCSVRNLVLTSGTLAPFKSFELETRLDYKIVLANPHIVNAAENLLAGVFQKGPQGNVFNFCYANKDKEEMFVDLGETIINLARQIPNGVLIVFASYQLLEKTYALWSKGNVLKRLEEIKPIIKEPKSSGALNDRMNQYIKLAKQPKGAILMAVCRGKISEGLDFSDELARGVLMVGIPFPPIYDRRVALKQRYLDVVGINRVETKKRLSGREWYLLQAIRAMNQAIGRVIRHKNDYGCVLFFDYRFGNDDVKREISGWIRDEIKIFNNFGNGYKEVLEFFRRKKQPTNVLQMNTMFKMGFNQINNDQNKIDTNQVTSIRIGNKNIDIKNNKKISTENENFLESSKPELKKIKTEVLKSNYNIDPINELMAIDFDTNQNNTSINLFQINQNNCNNNSIQNLNGSQSLNKQASSKTETDSENMLLKKIEDSKKSITLDDLKNLRNRDDLRNCTLTIDSIEELETYKDFLNQREKFECMICFMNKDELFSSKCGHMACIECWKRWLKEKLVCPKCKARVREKTLMRVFNN